MIQEKLIILGTKYLSITEGEFKKRIKESGAQRIKDWEEMGIERFYQETESYIYDLIDFNTEFRLDNLLHPIKYARGLKILEYGAGLGVSLVLLGDSHTTYYYDLPSKTQDFAKYINKNTGNKTIFIDTPEEALGLPLDLIICADVLEHLEDPMDLVKKITRSLEPGKLFLTTGLDFSVGEHIPMHLKSNLQYKKEHDEYMFKNYMLVYFHPTVNETVYLWKKRLGAQKK